MASATDSKSEHWFVSLLKLCVTAVMRPFKMASSVVQLGPNQPTLVDSLIAFSWTYSNS